VLIINTTRLTEPGRLVGEKESTEKQWEAATDHEGRRPGTVWYQRPRNSGRLLPITRVGDQALYGTRDRDSVGGMLF
jgi:hypothetical protein